MAHLAPIVHAGQNTYVPVQRGDVFVARDVLSALSYAVAQYQLGGAGAVVLVQVPDPGGGVARAARSRVGYDQRKPRRQGTRQPKENRRVAVGEPLDRASPLTPRPAGR